MLESILRNIPEDIVSHRMSFKKGEMIYTLADKGNFIYILVSGKAICQIDKVDGSFLPICTYEPYSLFGEIEIFVFSEQTAYIEAFSNCETYKIDKQNFLKWLKQDFNFALYIMQQLSEKLINYSQNVVDFMTLPVKERVLKVILNYYENYHLEQMTKEKLCYSVSAPLRSVNRALKALADEHIIELKGKQIFIAEKYKFINHF